MIAEKRGDDSVICVSASEVSFYPQTRQLSALHPSLLLTHSGPIPLQFLLHLRLDYPLPLSLLPRPPRLRCYQRKRKKILTHYVLLPSCQGQHHRLKRLLEEARAQGAAPTDEDLAHALQVQVRTIERDMAALGAQVRGMTRRR